MADLYDKLSELSRQKQEVIDSLRSGVGARLDDIINELADLLEQFIDDNGSITTGQLASLNQLNDLIEIVNAAGLQVLSDDIVSKVAEVTDIIGKQLDAAGLNIGQTTLDESALNSYVTFKVREVTDLFARQVAGKIQSAWLDSTFTGKPLKQALAEATAASLDTLKDMTAQQVETTIGTAVSSIDRAITAQLTTEDDTIVYVYVGPKDAIVRKSCQWIVGKWATKEQIAQLDNGQIPAVLITGGGWNCRHSWAPIKKSVAIKRGIEQVTTLDIQRFNSQAKAA